MSTTMSTYETRLRGAKNRIAEAITLTQDYATQTKLSSIVTILNDLIKAEAPITASEDLI